MRESCVTGDEEHLQIGPALTGRIRDLTPVQARQSHVGHKQVNAPLRLKDLQTRRTIFCFQRTIAEILEHLDNEITHHRLVLDDKHGLARLSAVRFDTA